MSVEEHTIELAGSPVFYRSAAGSARPILYLHGIPTSSDDLVALLERTGGIAPDLPGFGRSGKGGHLDYSIAGHAAFLRQFLDVLGIDRFRLVVHDWGAGPGLTLAQHAPERIERLVLINALPLLDGFRWPGPARLLRRAVVGELAMGATTRRLLARMLRQGGPWTPEEINSVWEQLDQGTQRAILRLYRSASEADLGAAGRTLHRVRAPALVIWGERDPWLPAAFAERYGAALPQATILRRAEAGHWPWREDPTIVDRVAEFLA